MKNLKVGDEVVYRGGFGTYEPKTVTVQAIILCENGMKSGKNVTEIDAKKVTSKEIIYDLSDGYWCRGTQIDMWKSTETK